MMRAALAACCLLAACSAASPASQQSPIPPSAASEAASSGISLKEIVRHPIGDDHIETIAFSPDGQRLAVGAEDGTVAVVKLQAGAAEGPAVRKFHVGH